MSKRLLMILVAIAAVSTLSAQTPRLDSRHWLVDAQAKSKSEYVFTSFQALNEAINSRHADTLTVYVRPWVYWIDNPNDTTIHRGNPPIGMSITCPVLTIVGLGATPSATVLASQRGQSQGAEGNFTMLDFHCDSLTVSNITFGDYLNVDLDYPLNPSLSRRKKSNTITQAQLAFMSGRTLTATDCRFVSRLNLCPIINADRSTYTRCHFESTDDALNGNATYTDCDFDFYGSRPLYTTNGYGAVFRNCTFNVRHNSPQYFTKQPGTVTVLDCRFNAPADTYVGWTPDVPLWLRCVQSGNTLNGKPLFIDARNPQTTSNSDSKAYEAARFVSNVSPRRTTVKAGRDTIMLRTSVLDRISHQPTKAESLHWSVEKGYERYATLHPFGSDSCMVIPLNDSNADKHFYIAATSADSLITAASELTVEPSELPVPQFTAEPKLTIANGRVTVSYNLNLNGSSDCSDIRWDRVEPSNHGNSPSTEVAATNYRPLQSYRLRPSDVGSRIRVAIYPKSNRSARSATPVCVLSRTIKAKDIAEPFTLETNFSDLPHLDTTSTDDNWSACRYKPADTDAYEWNKDDPGKFATPWYYGHGVYGCRDSIGLLENIQGARLVYKPKAKSYGDMDIVLDVTPAKTAGQGFSSNRMQYMDVYIKYDNRTMTGYGLRILRTLKHGNAVDFQLMSFSRGSATPVSAAVSSTCYRRNCRIRLTYHARLLSASATTDAQPSDPSLPNSVSLSANVAPNSFGDFAIQHTGTTGEGQTMLRHLSVKWQ